MMTWSERWFPQRDRIRALPSDSRFRLALACVDRAVWRLSPHLKDSAIAEKLSVLPSTLDRLWALAGGDKCDATELDRLLWSVEAAVPEDDSPEMLVAGWCDLLNALAYTLTCAKRKSDSESYAFDAAAHSYQAIFEKEVLSRLRQEMLEPEVKAIEQHNRTCITELEYQFDVLSKIERGESIEQLEISKL